MVNGFVEWSQLARFLDWARLWTERLTRSEIAKAEMTKKSSRHGGAVPAVDF